MNNQHQLYIIATPIGNIQEISNLAIQTLNSLKCILCEDTRTTKLLLTQLKINYQDKYLVSYHKFNEHSKLEYILELFTKFDSIGLVSDAGYPIINDPGYNLVAACYKNKIKVNVINGPCAAIHGLVVSGIPSNTFMYLGFLERTNVKRIKQLKQYQNIKTTFIIYESVHRLIETLKNIYEVFGNVIIAIGKELTKLHETIYRDYIQSILNNFNIIDLRGEFVIIVDNNEIQNQQQNEDWTKDELVNSSLKPKEKAKLIAQKYHLKTNIVYTYLTNKNKENNYE